MIAAPRPVSWPSTRLAAASLLGLALTATACGSLADDLFCDAPGCAFSDEEWSRLRALSSPKPPPDDPSNGVVGVLRATQLGQAFYFDTRFSGAATQVDALRRPAPVARAAKGQPANLSCESCHSLAGMGADVLSVPGNVSSGAGWTDVNALATVNSAYQRLFFWNGRVDSLWALSVAVAESPTTMNGNRLHTAWVIADLYRQPYDEVFAPLGQPFPFDGPSCAVQAIVETSGPRAGRCRLGTNDACPPNCGGPGCWPRFPLQGKPGKPGCQPDDPTEPFGDAWDCMALDDRNAVTQVLVNWAKALAAYQTLLVSVDAPFDRFVKEGPSSTAIPPAAQRGARLFVGKGGCIDCHGTPLFSDRGFHNVGVPQVGPSVPTEADCPLGDPVCDCVIGKRCLPWGAYDGFSKLAANEFLRTSQWSADRLAEKTPPEAQVPPGDALKGAWRTPSLRNVALTAPYMHDGVYGTLEQVVAHYARGGDAGGVGTRAVDIKPLSLSDAEQADLVSFLRTLTGSPLLPNLTSPAALPASLVCN